LVSSPHVCSKHASLSRTQDQSDQFVASEEPPSMKVDKSGNLYRYAGTQPAAVWVQSNEETLSSVTGVRCRSASGVTASIAAVMRTAHLSSPLESLAPHRPRPCAAWHHQLGSARMLQRQRLLRQERVRALREGQATIPCSRQMLLQRRQILKSNVGTTTDLGGAVLSSWLVLSCFLPYWSATQYPSGARSPPA
jgi:hypothetical protein